jgi:hypothetical protein
MALSSSVSHSELVAALRAVVPELDCELLVVGAYVVHETVAAHCVLAPLLLALHLQMVATRGRRARWASSGAAGSTPERPTLRPCLRCA